MRSVRCFNQVFTTSEGRGRNRMVIMMKIDCTFEPCRELEVVVVGFPGADEFCELIARS